MTYTHFSHRHNFAVWCAARAVQRNFTITQNLKEALEKSGIAEFIKENEDKEISQKKFDEHHERWCRSIVQHWEARQIKGATYGRAAKLVAVYIKSMIVVRNGQSNLSSVAHPPIDRIILKNISKDNNINHANRTDWDNINWTQLNEDKYKKLIMDFRQVFDGKPFWVIEEYWSITND
jgi:hypothetical protein